VARAFVAGATGYTGRHVVERLRAAGHEVIAHVRPDSSGLDTWRTRFEAMGARVDTSAWEADAMRAALVAHAPTHVFSLLGTTQHRMKQLAAAGQDAEAASYERVDYGLSALLIEAAGAVQPAPRFVYLSSMGVSSTPGAYMEARRKVEALLRSSGLPATIARPGIITGEDRGEDRPGERFGGIIAGGVFGALRALGAKKLANLYLPVTGDQLAHALVTLALDDAGVGVFEADALRTAFERGV
jgi:uncharacterized protein YbjT (DUF2867 family)